MALLGPGIREKIEHRLNFTLIEHEFDSLPPGPEVAEVFVLELIELLSDREASLKSVIKTDEIHFRIFLTVLHHEFAITGTDLNFKRAVSAELIFPLTHIGFCGFITENEGIKDPEFFVIGILGFGVLEIGPVTKVIVDGLARCCHGDHLAKKERCVNKKPPRERGPFFEFSKR